MLKTITASTAFFPNVGTALVNAEQSNIKTRLMALKPGQPVQVVLEVLIGYGLQSFCLNRGAEILLGQNFVHFVRFRAAFFWRGLESF